MNQKFELSNSLRVGVLCGGASSERKISLRSGRAVYGALKRLGFPASILDPSRSQRIKNKWKEIDLAFVALHGNGGEDGAIQRRLEQKAIPYVGSSPAASVRAFDKKIAKRCFKKNGIPTPDYVVIHLRNWQRKLNNFREPYFIKPIRNGSSVGVFLVEDYGKSAEKIKCALRVYKELIAERRIKGRELTVGVLGKKSLPVIELIPKRSFYDYRAKYTRGFTEYLVPAPIERQLGVKIQQLALQVHRCLGLRDFSRVDMMVDERNQPYVLEANTIPGLTELSLLPKAASAAGLSFEELCCQLLWFAHRRGGRVKRRKVREVW